MIIGIGSDLIDIRRIEKSLERHGERFVMRVYTDVEQARRLGNVSDFRSPWRAMRRERNP